jgi:hypothetical protein
MGHVLRLVGALLLVAVVSTPALVPTASGNTERAATKPMTFTDERREDPGSADVTTVVVAHDDDGRLTLLVNIAGHPTLTQDMRIRIWLRDQRGRDSFLLVDPFTPAGFAAQLYRCKPRVGGLVCAPSQAANLRFSYARGAGRFSLDAQDLGLRPAVGHAARLSFWVTTLAGVRYDPTAGYDLTAAHFDRAPSSEGVHWTYAIRLPPPDARREELLTTPRVARAGKPYIVSMAVARTDTGTLLARGVVSCSARVAGRALAGTGRFAHRRAECTFRIPADALGKRLRGSISVASAGQRVTRTFAWWVV